MENSMFNNLKVGVKIGGGYVIMGLVLISVVLATIYQVSRVKEVNHRIMELRAPTANASLSMLNGINHSLAALRGWMILGKDTFKVEREQAWSTEIEPALKTLQSFAVNWTNPENVARLKTIEGVVDEFKVAQQKIEDIAQTPANVMAMKILFEEAAPQTRIVRGSITRLIDFEQEQAGGSDRKQLLGIMADIRGAISMGLSAAKSYFLTGDTIYKELYLEVHTKRMKRFEDLKKLKHLLTQEQEKQLVLFEEAAMALDPIVMRIYEAREADDWNRANYWLGTEAAPKGATLVSTLKAMAADQKALMAKDEEKVQAMYASLSRTMWIFLFAGVVACVILGLLITRAIVNPVSRLWK